MKKISSLLFLISSIFVADAQNFNTNYAWKWAVLNYSCPEDIIDYPTGLDYSEGPDCMGIDSMGNVYLFGLLEVSEGLDYTLAANTNSAKSFTQNNQYNTNVNTSLYLMKLNNKGEIVWCKDIVTPGIGKDMELTLYVDAKSATSHILLNAGFEIKLNDEFVHTPYSGGVNGTMLSFNSEGNLIDTVWYINNLIPGDSGSFLYTKPGPWPNQFDIVRHTFSGDKVLTTFNYSVPNLIYNPYQNVYYSFSAGSSSIRIFDKDLVQKNSIIITGDAPDMLGTDFKVAFKKNGDFMITYYDQKAYANWLLYIDSDHKCKWFRTAGSVAAFDGDGNPWTYYKQLGLVEGKHIVPFRGGSCVAIKLDEENGNLTDDFVAPTYTSFCIGSDNFLIDQQNRFYMAGTFRYEIEFGKTVLSQVCSNKAFGRTQFVSMATPGKDSTRFSTGIREFDSEFTTSVYPVPFSDRLFVNTENVIDELCIYNLNGQQLFRVSLNASFAELDLSFLNAGVYHLKLISGNRITFRRITKY